MAKILYGEAKGREKRQVTYKPLPNFLDMVKWLENFWELSIGSTEPEEVGHKTFDARFLLTSKICKINLEIVLQCFFLEITFELLLI